MTDRRRRLIKYMFKKEGRLEQFDEQYPETIRRKDEVIQRFSSFQLEELLNNSTKNVAQEVVTCLIPKKGEGVLLALESQMQTGSGQSNAQSSSQQFPMPKTADHLPQPVPFREVASEKKRSPVRQIAGERDRPQFVAPHSYQPGNGHEV